MAADWPSRVSLVTGYNRVETPSFSSSFTCCNTSFLVMIPSRRLKIATFNGRDSSVTNTTVSTCQCTYPLCVTRVWRRPSLRNISITVSIGVWSVMVIGAWKRNNLAVLDAFLKWIAYQIDQTPKFERHWRSYQLRHDRGALREVDDWVCYDPLLNFSGIAWNRGQSNVIFDQMGITLTAVLSAKLRSLRATNPTKYCDSVETTTGNPL